MENFIRTDWFKKVGLSRTIHEVDYVKFKTLKTNTLHNVQNEDHSKSITLLLKVLSYDFNFQHVNSYLNVNIIILTWNAKKR